MTHLIRLLSTVLCMLALMMFNGMANAVPSFARQTGMSCASCHTVFPELTPFGRQFKLDGYTLAGTKQVQSPTSKENSALKINELPPLSAMLLIGYTHVKQPADTVQNDSIAFPQELSLFYAGEISEKLGAFLQLTYEQASDNLSWDNADIRYADHTQLGEQAVTYGVTLNNSPTVQDLWNSTPVWGIPYVSSDAAATPSNSTLLEGILAQDVAGLGGYAMWNHRYYTELSLYRSAHLGNDQLPPNSTSENTISGVAPYLRLAWENNTENHSTMLGLIGMQADIYPTGVSGSSDRYADIGVDGQYQGKLGGNAVSAHASYIQEKRTLDATDPGAAPKLNSFKIDGSYFWSHHLVGTLGYFNLSGDDNTNDVWGTGITSPDSDGWSAELGYLPWQNTKLTAQYRMYGKFDGTSTDASNNDTLYLNAWFVW